MATTHTRPLAVSTLAGMLLVPLVLGALAPTAIATIPGEILVLDLGRPENVGVLSLAGIPACTTSGPAFCYESKPVAAVTPADYVGRKAVFIGWDAGVTSANAAALNLQAANLQNFMLGGGGVVAFSEFFLAHWQWVPGGVTSVADHKNDVVLTPYGSTHPAMLGQTSASLSNWQNSRHGYFTGYPSYFQVVATTQSTASRVVHPVTLAGAYGAGCILITEQDPDWHGYYQSSNTAARKFVYNALDWATKCTCGHEEPCEPTIKLDGRADPTGHDLPTPFPVEHDAPHFIGPVTVTVDACDCTVQDYSVRASTTTGLPGLGVRVVQTSPTTFVVTPLDAQTYLVTFTVYLKCPDGTRTVTTQFYVTG